MKGFFIFAQIKFMLYLFLNSISTGEVIIILVFILMFFGSKSIPGIAKTFGRTLRQIRDATDDIKRDIRNSTSEIEKDFKGVKDDFNKSSKSITDTFKDQTKDLGDISNKFKNTLESAGKETVSNKRKPVNEKFVSEEELISSKENKEVSSDEAKSEKPDSENSGDQTSTIASTELKKELKGSKKEPKISQSQKADDLKSAPDTEEKIDKDPDS